MHAIHTTQGFIISSRPYGEAGRILSIFTRDFGLVTATAQGIRLERSKLRYHAQELSFGSFSLVRGREFWRLTSAGAVVGREPEGTFGGRRGRERDAAPAGADVVPRRSLATTATPELIARLALLLKRFLHGEEANPKLFECIEDCSRFIQSQQYITDLQSRALESVTVLRMLHSLGYVGDIPDLNGDTGSHGLSESLLDSVVGRVEEMNRHINKALKESHL